MDLLTYNSKTIHTFTTSGTFATPGSFSETVEYLIVGGGGGGGSDGRTQPDLVVAVLVPLELEQHRLVTLDQTVSVQVGGGGAGGSAGGGSTPNPGLNGVMEHHLILEHQSPHLVVVVVEVITILRLVDLVDLVVVENKVVVLDPGGTGAPFPGTIGASPTAGWGYDGGTGAGNGPQSIGGGGGGAGGAGRDGHTTQEGR